MCLFIIPLLEIEYFFKLHVASADIGVSFYKTLQIQARQNRKTNISHFCFSFITILYAGYR